MRILMTTDAVGGVWSYATTLCDHLARRGADVHLAVAGPAPSEAQRERAAAIPRLRLHEGAFDLEWMDEPWEDVERCNDWLAGLCRDVQPDIFHANMYSPLLRQWPCPTLLVTHSCVCTWWRCVHGEPAPERYKRYRSTVQRALCAADHVVSPTKAFADMMRGEYSLSQPPLVIKNGADAPEPADRQADDASDGVPTILTVGRLWDEAKNLAIMLEVMTELDAHLTAIGDHPATLPVQELPMNVELSGSLSPDEVDRRMQHAHIFAAPSLYEPFGLAVLEAAQRSCALVLADIPTFRELWDDAALFVPPDDVHAVRSAIGDLLNHPAEIDGLGAAACRRAHQYSAEDMCRRYLALYRSLRIERSGADDTRTRIPA